ncbi:DUF805 domain-containing protein [Croceicoccus marinus]|uniref:DUF805 domain-containing protein n=1 Tax=Croceicoccus marinus TaxID=450378 RepID=A0A1Z1F9J7_9SPHN|nr:DUF805 domain-containing protein [Croceicoccus marinus]ARU15424.1 DUF805 domain-containing protein [Croceicoccus marinus]
MQYMLMPLARYFDFSGRSRRKEYWMFALLNLIIITIFVTALLTLGISLDPYDATGGPVMWLVMAVLGIYSLLILIPSIAVQVRRFHDQDKSGWFVLINFVPYIGGLIVLVFMLLEGTRGPNKYGPDSKESFTRGV